MSSGSHTDFPYPVLWKFVQSRVLLLSLVCATGCGATQTYKLDSTLSESGRALLAKEGFAYEGDKRDVGRELLPFLQPGGRFQPVIHMGRRDGIRLSKESSDGGPLLCLLTAFLYCSAPWEVEIRHLDASGAETRAVRPVYTSRFGFLIAPLSL